MKRREEDRAVAIAAAIAEELKAMAAAEPVKVKVVAKKGSIELPSGRLNLPEMRMQLFGPGTAHNN